MQSAPADVSVNLVENHLSDYNKHDPEHYGYDQGDLSSTAQYREQQNWQMYGQPSVNRTTVVTSQSNMVVAPAPQPPDNHMGLAVFTCLCCCWPLGLAAICASNASSDFARAGDYYRAGRKAKTSQRLSMAGIVSGIVIIALFVVIKFAVLSDSS